MTRTFRSNAVTPKIELCKCLRWDSAVLSNINDRIRVTLLCSVVKLDQSVEHFQLPSSNNEDWVV